MESPKNSKPASGARVCSVCGAADGVEFADTIICVECYAKASSCCPEFDLDELAERQRGAKKPARSQG